MSHSSIYYDCNQASYRWDNARRDRVYGKIANQHATVDTSEFADKVRDYNSRALCEPSLIVYSGSGFSLHTMIIERR